MSFNYDQIEPGLFLGSHPGSSKSLEPEFVQAVLNVSDFDLPSYLDGLQRDVHVVRQPFEDCWPIPHTILTVATLELADLLRRGIPTLVHCRAGIHRSPTIVALYLMSRDDRDWKSTLGYIRSKRPFISPDRHGEIKLTTQRQRLSVVETVRNYLNGDESLLHEFRNQAIAIRHQFEQRPENSMPSGSDWDEIDQHFVIGERFDSWDVSPEHFDSIVIVRGSPDIDLEASLPKSMRVNDFTFPESESLDQNVLQKIQTVLSDAQSKGKRTLIIGPHQDFFAVACLCARLMQQHAWEPATAIWYVGSRRPKIWSYLDILVDVLDDFQRAQDSEPARSSNSKTPAG